MTRAGKQIVVAVDGSAPSISGVRYAARLAKALGMQVETAFVSPPNLLLPSIYPEAHREVEARAAEHAAEVLAKARAAAAQEGMNAVGIRLGDGTADAIANLAQSDQVYAVVVGVAGHSAVARALLGSFADRLVHVCTKPVFVVR
jgi:nucleotide-binding universal stress UspA family protein